MRDGGGAQDAPAGRPRVVADRLRRARDRRFVGRRAELGPLRAALAAPEPPFAVAFVHGPGGVGKSALLRAVEAAARGAGLRAARVDLRSIEPSPPAFCSVLGGLLGRSERDVRTGALGEGRCVLLLDTYEAAGAFDGWLREELLPSLPARTLVVIAGRDPPDPAWRGDPGWRDLLRVLPLDNLPPREAKALLRAEGVEAAQHDRLLALTHGHPLALSLLVDVIRQPGSGGAAPAGLSEAPDVVRTLLGRFLAGVPSPEHRRALGVCAQARATTEALLRDALGADDAREAFDWLRSLSFVDEDEHGLFPHDLARDVLAADARWRDPSGHAALHRRVHDHVLARIAEDAAAGSRHAVEDLVHLHRGNPFTARLWDWRTFGDSYADGLRDEDRAALPAMAARHESADSAALVSHWMALQPGGFLVFRGTGGRTTGFAAMLALHATTAADRAADPAVEAMWAWTQRTAPPRPGEQVHAWRFVADAAAGQAMPSPTFNALTVASTRIWLGRRRAAWELLGPWEDPDAVAPMMAYIGFGRVPGADHVVDGRRLGVYAHDWRRLGPRQWLAMMATREAAPGFAPPAPEPPGSAVLAVSRVEFGLAVRQALRDVHRPDALARNPLAAARLVGDRDGEAAASEVLEALLRQAVASLGQHPRDEKLQRVLDRTYLRPAPTQERAAELLGLPISTYRRQLAQGVERVADRLWEQELYGTDAG